MEIRRATMDDALEVLEWRNDAETVAMSKSGPVAVSDHLAWFANAVSDPDRNLFIAAEGKRRIGIVRFDSLDDSWLVSINIAPAERGKGYGVKALQKAMAEVSSCRFLAEIKADNVASIRVFERCGFRQIGAEDGWLHFVRLELGS